MNENNEELTQEGFFLLLEQFYADRDSKAEGAEVTHHFYPEAVEFFRWIRVAVEYLESDIENVEWDQIKERCLRDSRIVKFMDTFRGASFPSPRFIQKHTQIRQHDEIKNFLKFIKTNQALWKAKAAENALNKHEEPESVVSKYWHNLKEKPVYRGKIYEPEQREVEFYQQLNRFKRKVSDDINSLLPKVGLLYVLGLKVQFNHKQERGTPLFESFFRLRDIFLLHCEADCNILRIAFKPMIGLNDSLEYFAILLVQSPDGSFVEQAVIRTLEVELQARCSEKFPSLDVNIINFNEMLRSSNLVEHQSEFFLSEFSARNTRLVWKWFFGFLYYWETFQCISSDFLGNIDQRRYRVTKPHDLYFESLNDPENISCGYALKHTERFKHIWKTEHLSEYSKDYLENLTTIYTEYLAGKKQIGCIETAIQLEIFMLTLKESAIPAFEPRFLKRRDNISTRHSLDELVTRPLLQFIEIIIKQDTILQLSRVIGCHQRSRLLAYFLDTFHHKLSSTEQKAELETILGVNIANKKNQAKVERLISDFIYPDEIFVKKAIRTKAPAEQQSVSIISFPKLVDIPRHKNRLIKVRDYLKAGMKTDVVVIRARLSCDVVGGQTGHKVLYNLEQQELSEIFYKMMHAGRRCAPLSQITAYIGCWQGRESVDDRYTNFAAEVFFIFKSNVLHEHNGRLGPVIQLAWYAACQKYFTIAHPELYYKAVCKLIDISQSDSLFQVEQCLIETINTKRRNFFINHISSFVVYHDLLDDPLYKSIPKWLIRGTEPRR